MSYFSLHQRPGSPEWRLVELNLWLKLTRRRDDFILENRLEQNESEVNRVRVLRENCMLKFENILEAVLKDMNCEGFRV